MHINIVGHGKLLLGDGGYYEGAFAYGEIEGHGYRVFGLTGATYSGQFHRGEMHGQGILRYPNGEQYEGSWAKGRKEGDGIYCIAGNFHIVQSFADFSDRWAAMKIRTTKFSIFS